MSVAEAEQVRPLVFGEIDKESMAREPRIIKLALPLIRDACKHSKGRFTHDTVFDGINDGRFKLWGVFRPPETLESVAITAIDKAPGGRVFDILLVGPMVEPMFKHMPRLMMAARAGNCAKVRVIGPNLWRRWLADTDGWRPVATVFERDVII